MKQLDAASAGSVDQQGRTVAQRFNEERAQLRALPERPLFAVGCDSAGRALLFCNQGWLREQRDNQGGLEYELARPDRR